MPADSEATTTIDSLAELLKTRGKMELSKIATTLGVNQGIVENWSKVLEEGRLVRISYEVGKMYVEPMTVTKEQESALAATVEAEKMKLENDLVLQRTSLDRLSVKLEAVGISVQSAEALFHQRFPQLESQLDGINKIYAALEMENRKIDEIEKHTENIYSSINKKVDALFGKVEGVDANTLQGAKEERQKIREVLKRATELESQLTLLAKSKDKAIETIKKSIEEQLKALEKDLAGVERGIDAQLKSDEERIRTSLKIIREHARSLEALSKQINSFGRDKESVKKALGNAKNAFNDEYARISTRMESTGGALRSQIKHMEEQLNALKQNFGEVSKMYDTLQKATVEIENLQKKIADIGKVADTIDQELKALQTMKGSTEAKVRATRVIAEKVGGIVDSANGLTSDVEKVEKGIAEAGEE